MAILENDLAGKCYGGKYYEYIYTRFVQGYILPKKFGFNKPEAAFINTDLVRPDFAETGKRLSGNSLGNYNISCSKGMRIAVKKIIKNKKVKISLDLKTVVVCVLDDETDPKYSFRDIIYV